MCDPVTAAVATAAVLKAGAQVAQGVSAYNTGKAQEKLSQAEARSALEVGAIEEGRIRDEGKAFLGQQRVAQAASGVDISTGSPADVAAESARNIELDALTRRYQARVQSWGKTIEGRQANAKGSAALTQGIIGATSTLLTSGASGDFGSLGGKKPG